MAITQQHVGKTVTFLYGPKGYGEGVLLSINGDQARVRATKLQDTASSTWRRTSQEVNTYAPYCTPKEV